MTLSVVIIVLNEESNIEPCLQAVGWADEIVVVDGGSTDRTVERARQFTPKVYKIPFRDFSSQKNEALDRASCDWILFLDADERVTAELASEIQQTLRATDGNAAYAIGRHTYFFGKPLRFSGTREDYPIRLIPRGKAHFEQPVHETVMTPLPVLRLKNKLIHYSTRSPEHYRAKLECYIPLEARTLAEKGRRPRWTDLWLRPAAKFGYLYFWKLGILDGVTGLEYAAFSAYYGFLKYRYFYRSAHRTPAAQASSLV